MSFVIGVYIIGAGGFFSLLHGLADCKLCSGTENVKVKMKLMWNALVVTGVLYSMSESFIPDDFDRSLWSNYMSSRIQSSLRLGLTSLKRSLDILGTKLIKQFSSCFCKCHDVEWLADTAIPVQSMELKPPCGAISMGIVSGNYTTQHHYAIVAFTIHTFCSDQCYNRRTVITNIFNQL